MLAELLLMSIESNRVREKARGGLFIPDVSTAT